MVRSPWPLGAHAQLLLPPGAVLFCDFDGPLVDVSQRYYRTYRLALAATAAEYQAHGIALEPRPLTVTQFWQMKQNRLADEDIAHWSGLQYPQVSTFMAHVQRLVNQTSLLSHDRLQPLVGSAIALLQQTNIRLVLVTLRQTQQVAAILRQYELEAAVSQIYGAEDDQVAYGNRADHKTALLHAAIADQQQQGYATETAWMVGDTEADILAGQALGVPTIALTCGVRSQAYLSPFQPTEIHANLYGAVERLLLGICTPASSPVPSLSKPHVLHPCHPPTPLRGGLSKSHLSA